MNAMNSGLGRMLEDAWGIVRGMGSMAFMVDEIVVGVFGSIVSCSTYSRSLVKMAPSIADSSAIDCSC